MAETFGMQAQLIVQNDQGVCQLPGVFIQMPFWYSSKDKTFALTEYT